MNALAQHFARDRRKALAWSIAITVAVLLAAGGALAGAALAGGSPGAPGGRTGSLNVALSSAGSTSAATTRRLGAIARLRRLGGMYGQFSFRARNGATRTVAFERGVITSAGGDLVVKAANGTTWTWQLTNATVVRKDGVKGSRSDLSSGELVLVAGPAAAGPRDARLIVIRPAPRPVTGAPASPSAAAPAAN
jgi:hypothetical protein